MYTFDYNEFNLNTDGDVKKQRQILLIYLDSLKLIETLKHNITKGNAGNVYELSMALKQFSNDNSFYKIGNLFKQIQNTYDKNNFTKNLQLINDIDTEYLTVIRIIDNYFD